MGLAEGTAEPVGTHPMPDGSAAEMVRYLGTEEAPHAYSTGYFMRDGILYEATALGNLSTKEELVARMVEFKGLPQELALPSAPRQFIQYLEEDNRPQVKEDVDFENGMGISVGRLREDTVYDYKFVGLSHNTVRGAAGGAVLCAELLTAQGYIQAKE